MRIYALDYGIAGRDLHRARPERGFRAARRTDEVISAADRR
jgi:hypothetical protein